MAVLQLVLTQVKASQAPTLQLAPARIHPHVPLPAPVGSQWLRELVALEVPAALAALAALEVPVMLAALAALVGPAVLPL